MSLLPARLAAGALCAAWIATVPAGLQGHSEPPRRDQAGASAGQADSNQPESTDPSDDGSRDVGPKRSFLLPVIEIIAMNGLVNLGGRQLVDRRTFAVSPESVRRNLRAAWVIDEDPFVVNQLLHAYQGAMYHNIARSSGLGYWQSVAYTFAGSALWEVAGETTPPSLNDQIASGIAGSWLGEPLFLTARLLLGKHDGSPGFWRTFAAAIASPPSGINRLMFGDRFDAVTPRGIRGSDIRVHAGAQVDVDTVPFEQPASVVGFSIDHGFPGFHENALAVPFSHFRVDVAASGRGVETLASRGVIAGRGYGGGRLRGVVGAFATYDYFAPEGLQFSSTAASVGTATRAHAAGLTLDVIGLAGVGYSALQAVSSSEAVLSSADRAYHYGVTPQGLVGLRLIAGRRMAVDATARRYAFASSNGSLAFRPGAVARADVAVSWRVTGKHALSVHLTHMSRETRVAGGRSQTDAHSSVGLFYTFLGSGGFGAVTAMPQ